MSDPMALEISRRFRVPPAVLFKVWTQPVHLAQWWAAGPDYQPGLIAVDARPGGRFRLEMRRVAQGISQVAIGSFVEFEPDRRLACSWAWEDRPERGESRVSLDFLSHAEGGELLLRHEGLPDQAVRDEQEQSWRRCLDTLAVRSLLEGHPRVRPLLEQMRVSAWLGGLILADVDAEQAAMRVGTGHSMQWLLGHLLSVRQGMARQFRLELREVASRAQFAQGSKDEPSPEWPPFVTLHTAWDALDGHLRAAIAALDERALSSPAPGGAHQAVGDIGDLLAFLLAHESYHIGQMMMARRAAGLPKPGGIP